MSRAWRRWRRPSAPTISASMPPWSSRRRGWPCRRTIRPT
jgi:hypothetical protein